MDNNNDTRTENFTQPPTPQMEIPTVVNPLLARVHMPGSTFKLPSGGIFYKNGELAETVQNGELHIHPMTAYDEVLLKSPDLLFSGEAVQKIFKRCIPEILKPMELFGKDVDFLMICLRKMTYGDTFEMSYEHNCKNAKKHEYRVNVNDFIINTKHIDPTTIGKVYSTTIENGQIIELHPPRFKDVVKMIQSFDPTNNKSPEDETEEIVSTIMSVISQVDGIVNREHIKEWLENLPAGIIRDLSSVIENTTDWGPDFTFKTKCKDCEEKLDIVAPINPLAFFI